MRRSSTRIATEKGGRIGNAVAGVVAVVIARATIAVAAAADFS